MPESEDGGQISQSPSPPRDPLLQRIEIPKTRTAGNSSEPDLQYYKFAQGHSEGPTSRSRSRGHLENEHGLAPSGLHRIRQQPPQRQRSTPNSLFRSKSMTIPIPPHGNGVLSKPSSPVLTTTEDLVRFPTESLHSFSFSEKSNDFLQMRQNLLKRSVDLLKDKGMWANGGLATASAHAKINGDEEVQNMIELLNKANVLDNETSRRNGLVTGPASSFGGENVFEKSFSGRSESPEPLDAAGGTNENLLEPGMKMHRTPSLTIDVPAEPPRYSGNEPADAQGLFVRRPPGLRRTLTDTGPLSLQHQLTEALSQPYIADDNALLSPTAYITNDTGMPSTPFPGFSPHAHGRNAPTSQAIFTTEAQPPWTINASNDLACLAFGVQKAEIRKLSILDVVREDKRQWLENKLGGPRRASIAKAQVAKSPPRTSAMGNGVTARLLSKATSRETGQGRKIWSNATSPSSTPERKDSPKIDSSVPESAKTNGVLLCGDVVPIQKRNGDVGSATLWVQEKKDKLIWVMEEIAEDLAYLSVDEIGCVTKVTGKSEAVWGMEHVRRGMDVTRMIPHLPRRKGTNTGALDYDQIADLRGFTARTANDISIPITVDQLPGQQTFRVSSFPHIAGMMVVSASTLKVSSSNTVVSEALFGRSSNGLAMNDIIPGFDGMLNILVEDEQIDLIEGMVIPEHSFRKARAMLAFREGKKDAAAIFLRPNGLPAIHRDGAEIMVDIQMRVVRSETYSRAFADASNQETEDTISTIPSHEANESVAYAIWINYSKALHASNHGIGPISPLVSRPGTPPHQPFPSNAIAMHSESDSDDGSRAPAARTSGAELTLPIPAATKLTRTVSSTVLDPSMANGPEISGQYRKTMSINDYTILEDMGQGAYGQVKLTRPKTCAPPPIRQFPKIVIKYVTKRRILVDTWTRDRKLGTVPLEIHTLDYLKRNGLRHENIIEMIDFFEDDINYYILMKPHGLPGMDLFDYIELRVNMDEDECRRIFKQVVSAIHFLHTRALIVHRDIKDENVILNGSGAIKLIDFGSASYIRNGPFDVFVGTIDYAAPEMLTGMNDTATGMKGYDGLKQDIWALGILLYTILYKENPFYNIDEILEGDLRVPYVVSEGSIECVRGMLERDVEGRWGIEEVVRHPWLNEGGEGT